MKSLIFVVLIFLFFSSCKSKLPEYNEDTGLLCLDKYTIPPGREGIEVARVLLVNPDSCSVILSRDTSGLFEMNESGIIFLKQGKSLGESPSFRYEIEVQCNDYKKTFELVKDDFIRNKVIAHRGAWKHHDVSQNSVGSLKAGMELGCEAVEFDVWYSSDNVIVLSHDPVIAGKAVEDTPGEELRKIRLKGDENLPELKEYLDIIKTGNRTRLVLEIKASQKGPQRSRELAEAAVRAVHAEKAQAWVEYISFSWEAVLKIRELDPSARIAYLENNKSIEEIKEYGLSGIDYHFTSFYDDSTLIFRAHESGLTTNAWTVNKEEDMQRLLDAGIDYLTTDEPELLLKVVENDTLKMGKFGRLPNR